MHCNKSFFSPLGYTEEILPTRRTQLRKGKQALIGKFLWNCWICSGLTVNTVSVVTIPIFLMSTFSWIDSILLVCSHRWRNNFKIFSIFVKMSVLISCYFIHSKRKNSNVIFCWGTQWLFLSFISSYNRAHCWMIIQLWSCDAAS